ncbi:hypothetical protein X778_19095 [Pseudomonas aeruginosa VRFPA07]|nr:hypothetical protein X778_19095 [Pseudomonas aeruginosa VRFPA07]
MDWNKVGKWCVDSLREMVGEPVAIRRFLGQHRVAVLDPTELEETTSIAMSSVRPWHAWGDEGSTRFSRAMLSRTITSSASSLDSVIPGH